MSSHSHVIYKAKADKLSTEGESYSIKLFSLNM